MADRRPMFQERRPRWFLPHLLAGVAGVLLLGVLFYLFVFDWNWLKPMVERQASSAIGREVSIGDFDVSLRRESWIEMHDIRIANAQGFEGENLATAERIAIQVRTFPLLLGRIELPEIAVLRPRGRIESRADGRNNYTFDFGDDDNDGTDVRIGHLTIDEADIRYIDAAKKTDLRLKAQTDRIEERREPMVLVNGEGRYNGEPASFNLRGGALLAFRDPNVSYPLDVAARVGPNAATIKGTIDRPLDFAGADLDMRLEGDDMSELYPLIGLPIPPTPPYRLEGRLDFADDRVAFQNFKGTVGDSDLAGDFAVEFGGERPKMVGDLVSKKVVLADLAGFLGARIAGTENAEQKAAREKAAQGSTATNGKLLPQETISLQALHAMDAEVKYRGERIESTTMPFDTLSTELVLKDGFLTMKPLSFGVGEGNVLLNIALDGNRDPAALETTVKFERLRLDSIMRQTDLFKGSGRVAGNAQLKTTGNSVAQMLARGDGDLQIFIGSGSFSKLLLELIGFDVTEALGLALQSNDSQAELRCMIADMRLEQGILKPDALLLDTTDTNIQVEGTINLRDETLDLRIVPAPKDVSILTARGPILVEGPMSDPSIQPSAANVAGRATVAAILGVLLTPLAAIIPTIELGLGEDSDCQGLIGRVRQRAADRGMPIGEN